MEQNDKLFMNGESQETPDFVDKTLSVKIFQFVSFILICCSYTLIAYSASNFLLQMIIISNNIIGGICIDVKT